MLFDEPAWEEDEVLAVSFDDDPTPSDEFWEIIELVEQPAKAKNNKIKLILLKIGLFT